MNILYLHFLTIFPSVVILIYFFSSDKFQEPKKLIFYTFIAGIIMTFFVGLFKYFLYIFIPKQGPFFNAFFDAALIEELGKFLVMYLFCVRFTQFNEPMDGIVYGTVVSLSFATYENYEYVFKNTDYNISYAIAFMRAITAIPMHAFCGVLMGFFIGKYFFRKNNKKIYLRLALIIPILFHGFYNYFLMEQDFNDKLSLLVLLILTFFTIYFHNHMKNLQNFKNQEKEIKKY